MSLNKRIVGGLLGGGGVAVTIATLGGLKIQDNIDYKNKVTRYRKLSTDFNSRVKEIFRGDENWYLPDWEDNVAWKKHHDRGLKVGTSGEAEIFKKKYPTMEKFKDFCYESAERKDSCEPGQGAGWCVECARGKDWS